MSQRHALFYFQMFLFSLVQLVSTYTEHESSTTRFGYSANFRYAYCFTAHSLYWPVFTGSIFCVVGLKYRGVMLPNMS
jgi:hypothetical protein